ncbi:hypothetical protein BCR33DRAFT_26179 [Rhizoclosmatium globosum]|uniref:Uncharacterized protein n=1 Tax=Rhizoclosmatium globosum TaxID=329046 RepID=A0A1Y2AXQ8_9FUNG|nr:hypothetical protein BCR33DRAFT_26179 [Rhizoclosmatium globosum]|eukprot:ORY27276.1 hypothetical protein BCR33DRAFT_26179 [Rhizoclosmatium globosum]
MHAFTTHHRFSSYSFNNSSPSSNPSTPTTTTKDRTLPRRSPSPNSGITWNPLSIRNKPTSKHPPVLLLQRPTLSNLLFQSTKPAC